MLDVFGLSDYERAMRLPVPLVPYAVKSEERRQVQRRLDSLMDAAMASELGLGKEYVDPSAPKTDKADPKAPYWSLAPFNRYRDALLGRVLPPKTPEQIRAEREAAEDADFADFEKLVGSL